MKQMVNISIKNKTKANTVPLHSIIIIVEILPFILRYILIFYLNLRSIAIFFNEKMNSNFVCIFYRFNQIISNNRCENMNLITTKDSHLIETVK